MIVTMATATTKMSTIIDIESIANVEVSIESSCVLLDAQISQHCMIFWSQFHYILFSSGLDCLYEFHIPGAYAYHAVI